MIRIVFAAFAGLLFLSALPAFAQQEPVAQRGLYLGGGLGAGFPDSSGISSPSLNTSADLSAGFVGMGTLGYGLKSGWRVELEGAYRENGVDGIEGVSGGGGGDYTAWSLMGNVKYEFPTGSRVTPYVGGGLGFVSLDMDSVTPIGASTIDDSDTSFAWQGIAGVGIGLSNALQLFAEYHYVGTSDFSVSDAAGSSYDVEFDSHLVLGGLRLYFGRPPPPPEPQMVELPPPPPAPEPEPMVEPAPPPPEPPQPASYLVFFDWDQSVLTVEADRIVTTAASNAMSGGYSVIEATGHADRSGPDGYNMGLSMRRAEAVQARLVALGVAADDIAIHWKGERDPLVATPDGVREPQNRRVEIIVK
jgi:outer membrane protein OmpA-like peptidoglycan-associated protein/opacity protein-like surface antigen